MFSIKFDVQRSIVINEHVDVVYKKVSDFNTWKEWSPWLCQEPGCPVDITGTPGETGHGQAWDGKQIGAGGMTLVRHAPNQSLDYELSFVRPWKSRATAGFQFAEEKGGTRVSWFMTGELPIFLFFMKKMMAAFVGMDYERGLNMLKEYVETGNVPSHVSVEGVDEQSSFYYAGVKHACRIEDVGPAMEQDFLKIQKGIDAGALPGPDFLFSFYHKFDLVHRDCEYTSGCGYFQDPGFQQIPQGMVSGNIRKHRALKVMHTGPYRHLGNAWSAAMGYQKSAKLKADKGIAMYEIYENMPHEVDEQNIKTVVFVPVK